MIVHKWSKTPGFRILLIAYENIDEVKGILAFFEEQSWAFGADETLGIFVSVPLYHNSDNFIPYPLSSAVEDILENAKPCIPAV